MRVLGITLILCM